jgi:hypothetical protein
MMLNLRAEYQSLWIAEMESLNVLYIVQVESEIHTSSTELWNILTLAAAWEVM